MLDRYQVKRLGKNDLYKVFIKKYLAGTNVNVTNQEVDILNEINKRYYKWDAELIRLSLGISTQNLNNYKKGLIKKGLLVKNSVQEYELKDIFRLPYNSISDNQLRITIDLFINEEKLPEEDIQEDSLEQQLIRENS